MGRKAWLHNRALPCSMDNPARPRRPATSLAHRLSIAKYFFAAANLMRACRRRSRHGADFDRRRRGPARAAWLCLVLALAVCAPASADTEELDAKLVASGTTGSPPAGPGAVRASIAFERPGVAGRAQAAQVRSGRAADRRFPVTGRTMCWPCRTGFGAPSPIREMPGSARWLRMRAPAPSTRLWGAATRHWPRWIRS